MSEKVAEKCSYCGELGHSIQNCPKWRGTASGPPVKVEEMSRALEAMKERLFISLESGEAKIIDATMFAAKSTIKDPAQRRVFVQDFAASLNRNRILESNFVDDFIMHGYIYMEAQ